MTKAEEYLKELSDENLIKLIEDTNNTEFPDNSPSKIAVLAIFGEINIFILQLNQLLYPLLLEVGNRFKKSKNF